MTVAPWKILLIDDDEDDYILTRLMLSESRGDDFHLTWAADYLDGLEQSVLESWDVILLDYMIGRYNGIDLARDAISRGLQAPIILLTGKGSYRVDLDAMRVGVMDYLVKGQVSAPVLERAIRYAIERFHAQRALKETQNQLEERVRERTRDLEQANAILRKENIERQKMEQALRESEARFRKLAESTSSAIFIVQDSRIVYSNPAACRITGYDCDKLEGMFFWDLAHPSYRQILRNSSLAENRTVSTPLQGNISTRYELKLVTGNGQERWVDVTLGSFEHNGKPALVVTGFDITERDIAEQALREAKSGLEDRISQTQDALRTSTRKLEKERQELEKRALEIEHLRQANSVLTNQLEALFAFAGDAIFLIGENWKITHVNRAAENLLGDGLIGENFEEILKMRNIRLASGKLASVDDFLCANLQEEEPIQQKLLVSQPKGEDIEVLAVLLPLAGSGHCNAGALMLWRLTVQAEGARTLFVDS